MMEIKETDKVVIAKPVPTRPGFSNFHKSFSQVISGTVNPSPPAAFAETAVTVIWPMTERFRSKNNTNLAKPLGPEASKPSEEVLKSKTVTNVVYKPIAKLVTKKTAALLTNLGGRGIIRKRAECQIDRTPLVHRELPLQPEKNENFESQNPKNRNKFLDNTTDRPSQDGHNWRKYGQKQVKGSEYPRSYYKCTRPNCPVKKKVEKMLDGRVSEVVYEGNHNHSNPREVKVPSFPNETDRVNCESGRTENLQNSNESQSRSNFLVIDDPFKDTTCNNATFGTSNSSMALSGECEEASEPLEADCREVKSKRMRRVNNLLRGSCTDGEGSTGPTTSVRKVNGKCETVGDMFRWRKYGQKVVKGKIYPRSYYRCTSPNCNVRKYVERISENPANFITTYEGRHNHMMPDDAANPEPCRARIQNV